MTSSTEEEEDLSASEDASGVELRPVGPPAGLDVAIAGPLRALRGAVRAERFYRSAHLLTNGTPMISVKTNGFSQAIVRGCSHDGGSASEDT